MNIQIFGKPKCFDTKKAERYFKERRIKYQLIDIVKYGMSGGEFQSVKTALKGVGGLDAMVDVNSKEYVSQHYAESFSIAKIAVSLGTTPENLNNVFMEKERVMLLDYVMWVRVFEAQQALRETDLDEEVIAVKVGFDDVKYFRSIFKKYNGENPADYRAGRPNAGE